MNLLQMITSQQSDKLERLAKKSPTVCGTGRAQQQEECPVPLSDAELRKRLTPEQYEVTQLRGTEKRFSGKYLREKSPGVYECVVCGQELFSSGHKFDSGCGWPAFYDVMQNARVAMVKDTTHGMMRYEIRCASCGAHLGHVFDDGPRPTGLRYCVNSAALNFSPEAAASAPAGTASEVADVVANVGQVPATAEHGTNGLRTDL